MTVGVNGADGLKHCNGFPDIEPGWGRAVCAGLRLAAPLPVPSAVGAPAALF